MKTAWDLSHFYKNKKDPKIDRDIETFEEECRKFSKRYAGKSDYLQSDAKLKRAIDEYEVLTESREAAGPIRYFAYLNALNTQANDVVGRLNLLESKLRASFNRIIFFELELGKLAESRKKALLKSATLSKYHYFLRKIFEQSRHRLSESEERIINLKEPPAHGMWVQGGEKMLFKRSVEFEGKQLPVPEAMAVIPGLPTKKRRELHGRVMQVLKEVSDYSEAEINAICTNKKIDDELRGFKKPQSETILTYENDDESVERLVKSVTEANSISKRFYKLKANLLGLDKLSYADRGAPVGKIKRKLAFDDCAKIVRDAFESVDQKYADIFDRMASNGQIDVFPKAGKTGGAFCYNSPHYPTYVLLNHTDDFRSLTTFAHEMGHAVHSEMSKSQSLIYQDYTISVAEVASTFFERIVFDHIYESLSVKERKIALHDRLNDSVSTVFRQIACFNFEVELHNRVRAEGSLSSDSIAKLMNKEIGRYLGPAVELTPEDGYFFVYWSHIRRFFYVYTYAYGELVSRALHRRYKRDPKYAKQIEGFLSAGGSKTPREIFKATGVDITDPNFFKEGLDSIKDDLKELEKLSK